MRAALCLLLALTLATAESDLELLLRVLPPTNTRTTGRINLLDKSWEDWQRRTGEQPPDFSRMPAQPFLPDPLIDAKAGTRIKTPAAWQHQRDWIRSRFEHWVFGKMPPAPDNLRATLQSDTAEQNIRVRNVLLEFGPDHKAKLRLQVLIPPSKVRLPVFLTNHPRNRPWVNTAVRRGYIGVIYFAADPIYGNTDDSESFLEAYPT